MAVGGQDILIGQPSGAGTPCFANSLLAASDCNSALKSFLILFRRKQQTEGNIMYTGGGRGRGGMVKSWPTVRTEVHRVTEKIGHPSFAKLTAFDLLISYPCILG